MVHRCIPTSEVTTVKGDLKAGQGLLQYHRTNVCLAAENSNVSELQRQAQAAERLQEAKGLQERRAEIQAVSIESFSAIIDDSRI